MRNAISILCFNNLELTKNAFASACEQDASCDIYLIDNGSTDGTQAWMRTLPFSRNDHYINIRRMEENQSPVKVSNAIMSDLFELHNYDAILGMPNDVVLPPNLLRLMLDFPRGIVTASMSGDPDFPRFKTATALHECTPMAVALIRRWMYNAMLDSYGAFFDEGFQHYASDCDFALRMSALGIRGCQLDVQYYHVTSATLKSADPETRRSMELQADADRAYFERKWGFAVADPYYGQSAADVNFKGKPLC